MLPDAEFFALSEYMFGFSPRLLIEFITEKTFMELKAIFPKNVLFKNLVTCLYSFFEHLTDIKRNRKLSLRDRI